MSTKSFLRHTTLLAMFAGLLAGTAAAQQQQQPRSAEKTPERQIQQGKQPGQPTGVQEQKKEEERPEDKLFAGMKYRLIGPFRGGRSLAVTGVPGNPNVYYFGAVGGGVWKTTDGALTWQPMFDKEAVGSIGAIAVSSADPNVIYAGTGEACIRGDISHGDGIYKSMDGGKTWKNVGLRDSRAIAKIIVHPKDPNVVFVAALGHQFGPNEERGIFRTTDGGKTWEKVLYKDPDTGGIDVTFDPRNPNVLFAALWQARRFPWGMSSGGPGSGLYRSGDGGSTWKRLEGNGLPKGIYGRIGVAVGATSDRVYALIENEPDGGLYRSDDGGSKWQLVNRDRHFRQRAWYYTHVVADPKDANKVYILNVGFHRSTDGGHTFNRIRVPHGDNHALWIDPENTDRMIEGNDGGATVTVDGGKTWSREDNQPTAQFYHVIADTRWPYYVYGSQQDNTSVAIASRSDDGAIDRDDWYPVGGGESGYIAPDPRDPNLVFAGGYEGEITRFDKRTGQSQQITVFPELTDGEGAANLEHRFQWTAPILLSPHDPNVLYHAGERLFRSSDGGMHWEAISPDLTRNDKSKQQVSGGPITRDDTGTEYYDTIFAVAESPLSKGLIWAGTDDGLVQITRDGGKNWANVTPKELAEWSRISQIDASVHNAGTAYVAVDRHQLDDLRPYIYKTSDYGKTWTKIVAGIPENTFVRVVREDPKRAGLLYAGTETGVFVSFNDGQQWRPLKLNLPTTPIHDLVVKDNDLVLATHGRSFWILDDVSPLRQFSEQVAQAPAHLYQPATTIRYLGGGRARSALIGQNPPAGAIIDFYLAAEPKGETTIEILDGNGRRVRKYSSEKIDEPEAPLDPEDEKPKKQIEVKAGLNRFVWDLRYEGVRPPKGYYLYDYREGAHGPLAVPGTYQVRLTTGGKTLTAPLELKVDPRVCSPVQPNPTCTPQRAQEVQAALEKQFNLIMDIQRELARVYEAVNQMQDVRAQMKDLRRRIPQNAALKLEPAAEGLDKKMAAMLAIEPGSTAAPAGAANQDALINLKIESNQDSLNFPLGVDGDLAYLAINVAGDADAAPTEAQVQQFAKLKKRVDAQIARWNALVTGELASFQKLAREQNLAPIILPAGTATEAGGGERR